MIDEEILKAKLMELGNSIIDMARGNPADAVAGYCNAASFFVTAYAETAHAMNPSCSPTVHAAALGQYIVDKIYTIHAEPAGRA